MEKIETIIKDIEDLVEEYRQKVEAGELPDVRLDDIKEANLGHKRI